MSKGGSWVGPSGVSAIWVPALAGLLGTASWDESQTQNLLLGRYISHMWHGNALGTLMRTLGACCHSDPVLHNWMKMDGTTWKDHHIGEVWRIKCYDLGLSVSLSLPHWTGPCFYFGSLASFLNVVQVRSTPKDLFIFLNPWVHLLSPSAWRMLNGCVE